MSGPNKSAGLPLIVIPAQAVRRSLLAGRTARCWIPACAGMTEWVWNVPKPSP